MKSFKKLFAIVAATAMFATSINITAVSAASYSDELQGAYDYAYGMGITTQPSIADANMYDGLIRSHMAKMMVAYAKEMGKTADTSVEVNFTDIDNQSPELQGYIEEAAQMGLMGLNADGSVATKFNPAGIVTRAQFGTVLSRVLYGDANNGSEPYYAAHLEALKDAGIMNNISTPNATEVRGYVMLMMQRADEGGTTPATCSTVENILACSIGTSACPAECKDTPVAENANGSLSVKLGTSNGMDIPYGIPSLEVATYKFTADEDMRIDSLVLERLGFSDLDTLDGVSLFINGGRVSKVAKFNSNDEATASITNGYAVKAGETVEIAVNVAVATGTDRAGDQFAIKLVSVGSTAEDVNLGSVTSETFKILSKQNASISYTNGSAVDAPKVGSDSDLFEFVLDNSSNQDSTLKAITFKDGTGTIDESADLKNFKLVVDGETIATASKMSGKYLTFNVEDGYQIDKSDKATFTVQAEIVDGANETIAFSIETPMDVVVIGDTYDVAMTVAGVPASTKVTTVSAGKVALAKVNTAAGDLIKNNDNVFLGAFTITNNADQSLNLEDLKLTIDGSDGILDNVKVKLGSTTASPMDLTQAANVWSDTDFGKAIGSKLTVYVYADVADVVVTGSIRMALTSLRIVENANDTAIEDVTPTTLTWSTINGQTSNGNLTRVALADKTVSEGTEDVEAIQFKIKAGEAYGTKIKKITFDAATTPSTGIVDGDTVTSAILYNGTTEIPATIKAGTIVVDEDFTIAAGTTATLTLKVGVASNPEFNSFKYTLDGANIDAVDLSSDADDVTFSRIVAGRLVSITNAGEVVSTYEATAANNKYEKDILAGDSKVVAEYSVYSKYETVNVASGVVTFDADVEDSVLDVQLYYGSDLVASNPEWTGTDTAVFSDIDFDTATAKKALTVKIVSKTIDDNAGKYVSANVTSVTLDGLKGNHSGKDIVAEELTTDSEYFNIVPVTLVPAVTTIGTSKGFFTVSATNGSNTTSGGEEAVATVTRLYFTVDGNNGGLTALTIKDDAGNVLGSSAVTSDDVQVELTNYTPGVELSNGGSTEFTVSATLSGSINTPSYNVSLNGIDYDTNVDNAQGLYVNFGAAKTVLTK